MKRLWKKAQEIGNLEPKYEKMSKKELAAQTEVFKKALKKKSLDDILPEVFAVAREVSKRVLGLRPYDVQLIGGMILHQGRISEMRTGEGKTLVSTLPAYLNALEGKGVHVVTVNDYLAKRDAEWMGKVHKFMGLKVGVVVPGMEDNEKLPIFQRPVWVVAFALTAAMAWGWAYPLIKLGFAEFGITQTMTAGKMLFAGVRFTLSGLIVLSIAACTKRRFSVATSSSWLYILLFALLNTGLHYYFFYVGLSYSAGARAAILNSLGVFMLVLLACIFFKSDRLTFRKIAGCVIGFAGIMALNLGAADSGSFTFMGDGMIILNAFCSAFAGLMTRGLGKRVDVFVGTGYSLALGGVMLVVPGILMDGTLPDINAVGVIILMLLV